MFWIELYAKLAVIGQILGITIVILALGFYGYVFYQVEKEKKKCQNNPK